MIDLPTAPSMTQSAVSMRAAGMEDTAAVVERQLETDLAAMPLEDALCLARAFSHYLNLMGIAETHHRYRPRRLTYHIFISMLFYTHSAFCKHG
jgi:phosphoenolpyruvate carboxylase